MPRIYHEADLLIAEALGSDVLAGAEPSVVAGVLSAVVQDIRDESDRLGMRVVLTLRQGDEPKVIENQLYKNTALESTFGIMSSRWWMIGRRSLTSSKSSSILSIFAVKWS